MDWNKFYSDGGFLSPDFSQLNNTGPARPRDNQQYQAPMQVQVTGGADYGQVNWGAFYGDILPYYQTSGVDVNTLDRLPQGDPPGWANVDRITMTAAQIANGEVITGIPLPRARPKDHIASETTIGYVPTAATNIGAPSKGSGISIGLGNPGADFGVTANVEFQPDNIIGQIFQGFQKLFAVAPRSNTQPNIPGVQISQNGIQLSLNDLGLAGLVQGFSNAFSFEFTPAEFQSPGNRTPTFTQAEVESQWSKGNLNQASYDALREGSISYVSSDGSVQPTTSMSGKIRNTYGD